VRGIRELGAGQWLASSKKRLALMGNFGKAHGTDGGPAIRYLGSTWGAALGPRAGLSNGPSYRPYVSKLLEVTRNYPSVILEFWGKKRVLYRFFENWYRLARCGGVY